MPRLTAIPFSSDVESSDSLYAVVSGNSRRVSPGSVSAAARAIGRDVQARNNGVHGFAIESVSTAAPGVAVFSGCQAYGNTNNGFNDTVGGMTVILNGCAGFANGGSGIRTTQQNTTVTGGWYSNNSQWGFDNGAVNARHTVVGAILTNNSSGNLRAGGAQSVYSANITA